MFTLAGLYELTKYKALKFRAKGVYNGTRLSSNIENNDVVC